MKLLLSVILGCLSLLWYSMLYPKLFIFGLEPAVEPCCYSASVEVRRSVVRLFLWLMDLPLNIVIFSTYSALIVLGEKYIIKLKLSYFWLSLGVVSGYIILVITTQDISIDYTYCLVSILTYIFITVIAVWCFRRLINNDSGGILPWAYSGVRRRLKNFLMSSKNKCCKSKYKKEKIFYISLQRTGTKSFGKFFRNNGYQVVSWNENRENKWGLLSLNGDFDKILNSDQFLLGEAFEDGPWFHISLWKYLYWKSDNYRFVFFERPFEDWFSSMLSHSKGKNPGNVKNHSILYQCLDDYYEKLESDDPSRLDLLSRKDVYRRAYDNHRLQVIAFFEDKDPKRFFRADLYDESKYLKLANHFDLEFYFSDDVHIHKSIDLGG